ncbi:hypothetical protein Vretifemale_8576 [Volvox reticuliferus]|uniref:Uncharacterized protein n=1 Tax=Volvox reticuliferus TaxID=1737510 RepID=A0A8J4FNE1_9CHLO|nr:hypothetical protein Vretifemale_8576 [Volvox reticuliferus]
MHLVYRAPGSGVGQSEVVKDNGYEVIVDLGISDTPMPDMSYADLTTNAKITMVHIPVLLAVSLSMYSCMYKYMNSIFCIYEFGTIKYGEVLSTKMRLRVSCLLH